MAFLKGFEREVDMATGQGSYNLQATLARGSVPDRFYGLNNNYGGSSAFAGVAHRGQAIKQMHNLVNDGVATQLKIKIADENGEVTTPFALHGKIWKPDKTGWARVVDSGKLDLDEMIAHEREQKTKRVMKRIRPGDSSAAYLFGYTLEQWKKICAMTAVELKKEFPGIEISPQLADGNICTLQHIKSLPPDSITQSHTIAKLNLICEYLADTVNEEALTSINDTMSNMKDGHNVLSPDVGDDMAGLMGENVAVTAKNMKKRAERNIDKIIGREGPIQQ